MSKYDNDPTRAEHLRFLSGVESVLGPPDAHRNRRNWNDYAADWDGLTVQLTLYYGQTNPRIARAVYGVARGGKYDGTMVRHVELTMLIREIKAVAPWFARWLRAREYGDDLPAAPVEMVVWGDLPESNYAWTRAAWELDQKSWKKRAALLSAVLSTP